MDYDMPIMNGIVATKILVQRMKDKEEPLRKIPIVALTAYNGEKDACLKAGMKRFLTKPTSALELKQVLMDIINNEL
jgi:CheY-like chemotaxis protein